MALPPYAHTLDGKPSEKWEPLFTPFGDGDEQCQRENCRKCQRLAPHHGHLNKVAFWIGKFAAEMFAKDSPESQSAPRRLPPPFQFPYISSKSDLEV